MALSDKVLQAQNAAKRVGRVTHVNFDVESQAGYFVTMGGKRLLQFNSAQKATNVKNQLNAAIAPTKATLTAYYEQQVDDIINA